MRIKQSMLISLCVALLLLTVGNATAAELIVDGNGGGDYSTIQAAVAAATSGDTITVYQGTYNLPSEIVVNKELNIRSQSGPEVTTITTPFYGDGFKVDHVTNVVISGFSIKSPSTFRYGRGISLSYVENSNINDNKISGFYEGIYLDHSVKNTLNDNTIVDNDNGVFAELYCNYNTLTGNVLSQNAYGIQLTNSNYNNLIDNTVSNNPYTGIALLYATGSTLNNNKVVDNGYNGITLSDSVLNTLIGNTVSGNMRGIGLAYSDSNTIYNNYFDNTENVRVFYASVIGNTWNIAKTEGTNIIGGPYMGGNYWATPAGDGYSQIYTSPDGICDSPYIVTSDEPGIDYLPLCAVSAVVDPSEAIEDLQSEISTELGINSAIITSLNVRLDNVVKQLDKGDDDKALKKLDDFILYVNVLEKAGKLEQSIADELISEAENIKALIEDSEG